MNSHSATRTHPRTSSISVKYCTVFILNAAMVEIGATTRTSACGSPEPQAWSQPSKRTLTRRGHTATLTCSAGGRRTRSSVWNMTSWRTDLSCHRMWPPECTMESLSQLQHDLILYTVMIVHTCYHLTLPWLSHIEFLLDFMTGKGITKACAQRFLAKCNNLLVIS